jgi:hypothetical protein
MFTAEFPTTELTKTRASGLRFTTTGEICISRVYITGAKNIANPIELQPFWSKKSVITHQKMNSFICHLKKNN